MPHLRAAWSILFLIWDHHDRDDKIYDYTICHVVFFVDGYNSFLGEE